jgi:hypothetical protein
VYGMPEKGLNELRDTKLEEVSSRGKVNDPNNRCGVL